MYWNFNLQALTCTWFCLLSSVHALRILAIFPFISQSHFTYNFAIIRSLHDAGHQIIFITPFSDLISLPNVTVIDSKRNDTIIFKSQFSVSESEVLNFKENTEFWSENGVKLCHDVLNLKEVQEIYNSKERQYDVMFLQLISMYHCYLPLAEKLDIPVLGTTVARVWRLSDVAVGNPINPAALRFEYSDYSTTWSFSDRLFNFWRPMKLDFFYNLMVPSKIDRIYQQYYTKELVNKKEISLSFVNSHASFFPRPLVPNAIEIGGIHIDPASPLPKRLQKFMDEAIHGVIVFSLGAVTRGSTITNSMEAAFKNAFVQIPQRVIWKYEDSMDETPPNVMPLKWFPQRDILAHKNVKAFISHCGVSGTYEAIYEAVPMIMTPMYCDQKSNAAILEANGAGRYLDLYSLNVQMVLSALNDIINDTRYATNMQRLSKRFKDQPVSPQKSVVYWTEHVVRNKGVLHLTSATANMPLHKYLLLDVFAFIAAMFSICFCTFSRGKKYFKNTRCTDIVETKFCGAKEIK